MGPDEHILFKTIKHLLCNDTTSDVHGTLTHSCWKKIHRGSVAVGLYRWDGYVNQQAV